MNNFEFESIEKEMKKKYGMVENIKDGIYPMILSAIEGNMIKTHRNEVKCNSVRAKEAIYLTLHQINDYTNHKTTDVSKFENEYNLMLKNSILMAFDPFTNNDVKITLKERNYNIEENMETYYSVFIKGLLRIIQSIDTFIEMFGRDGYFIYMEQNLGQHIEQNNKMNYTILVPN